MDGGERVPFKDTASHWAKSSINLAVANGIIQGYGLTFGPDDALTREQMAVILAKALNLTLDVDAAEFRDNAKMSSWAVSSIAAVVSGGIMDGYPGGAFKPRSAATRAEVAAVLVKLLLLLPSRDK